jgi:hypothetical protein
MPLPIDFEQAAQLGRATLHVAPSKAPSVESQDGRSLFAGLRYIAGTASALFVQYATPCSSVQ